MARTSSLRCSRHLIELVFAPGHTLMLSRGVVSFGIADHASRTYKLTPSLKPAAYFR